MLKSSKQSLKTQLSSVCCAHLNSATSTGCNLDGSAA